MNRSSALLPPSLPPSLPCRSVECRPLPPGQDVLPGLPVHEELGQAQVHEEEGGALAAAARHQVLGLQVAVEVAAAVVEGLKKGRRSGVCE